MVTTPQAVALFDVRKGIGMFRDLRVPVLGVVENMSYYVCPHGERVALFGEGGGRELATEFGVPLLGQLPLHPDIRAGADAGEPVLVRRPNSPEADAFRALAGAVAARVSTVARLRMPRIS
jgi:ATP-binding protein involved in chromosome partitioning